MCPFISRSKTLIFFNLVCVHHYSPLLITNEAAVSTSIHQCHESELLMLNGVLYDISVDCISQKVSLGNVRK